MFTTNTFNYKCLNYLFYKQIPAKKANIINSFRLILFSILDILKTKQKTYKTTQYNFEKKN